MALYSGGSLTVTGQLSSLGGLAGLPWNPPFEPASGQPGDPGTIYSGSTAAVKMAQVPLPADKVFGVDANSLSFQPGLGSTSCRVYFGTDSVPVNLIATIDANSTHVYLRARQAAGVTTVPGTWHYWRADCKIDDVWVTGTTWKFRALGNETRNPSPAYGAIDAPIPTPLSWDAGQPALATSWDVYYGTSETAVESATPASPEFRTHITDANGLTGEALRANTTYYWRVDEYVGAAKTIGNVWHFTTRGPICAAGALGDVNGDCYVDFKDFALMAQSWGICNRVPSSDCN